MNFIKFLFFVGIIYLIFRFIGRYVFPFLIKRFVKKAQKNFYSQHQNYNNSQQAQKEGEVNIKYNKQKQSKRDKDKLGDYVDFEEVKEDNHSNK